MTVHRSPSFTLVAGSNQPIDFSFLPARGPNGGRNVVDRIILKHALTVTTDGGTTIAKGGWAAVNQRTILKDSGGELWNLTGPEIRAVDYFENGRFAQVDPTNIAAGATDDRNLYLVMNLAPRRAAKRGRDFAVPADHFLAIGGGQLQVLGATAAQVGTGGGLTLTTNQLTVYIVCHEERGVEAHSRRELRSFGLASATDNMVPINGSLLRGAFVFKAADSATGGTTEDSTTITCDAIGLSQVEPDVLMQQFAYDHDGDTASTTDPFCLSVLDDITQTIKALPIQWPSAGGKINELPYHAGQMFLRLNAATVTSNVIVCDFIAPHTAKNSAVDKALAGNDSPRRIKTFGKTARAPEAHGIYAQFMPVKL